MTTYAEEQVKLYYDTWALRRQGDLAKKYREPISGEIDTLENWITRHIDLTCFGTDGVGEPHGLFSKGITLLSLFETVGIINAWIEDEINDLILVEAELVDEKP